MSSTLQDKTIAGIISRMSIEDKAGQMFMGNFCGADSAEKIKDSIRKHRFGGLQLSLAFQKFIRKRDYKPCKVSRWRPAIEISEWLYEINKIAFEELGVPCFIGIDREHGGGMLKRCNVSEFPSGMGFAASGDTDLYYKAARIQARESRALGVNMIYGPVMDLALNPENPEVQMRPYSDKAAVAGAFAAKYLQACREEDVVCTSKHFPGRGRGEVDAHLEFETIGVETGEYGRTDLEAFRLAIEAGSPGIMMAHTHYTAYQSEEIPASLSKEVVTGLLRQKMGFKGLVIPDSLTMRGVSQNFSMPEAVVMALEAGNDMVFMKEERLYEPCLLAIKEAITDGRITESDIDAKLTRILGTKKQADILKPRKFSAEYISQILEDPESSLIARETARKSTVILKKGSFFSRRPEAEKNLLIIGQRRLDTILHNNPKRRHDEFFMEIRKRHKNSTFLLIDLIPTEDQLYEAEALLQNAGFIILAIDGGNNASIDFFNLLKDMKRFPEDKRVPVIVVNFAAPYAFAHKLKGYDSAIQEFGYMKSTVEMAAAVLFQEVEAGGFLPVKVSDEYPEDYGL